MKYDTLLLAIGNAGGNILETIRKKTDNTILKNACYVFADSDRRDLKKHESKDCKLVLLNLNNYEFPESIFYGVKRLVIIAGLGGNTGTKFTEIIVRTAKHCNINNIFVFVTIPFIFEGEERVKRAMTSAGRIQDISKVHLVIRENEKLFHKYENLNFFNAFDAVDKDISRLIHQQIKCNEDFYETYPFCKDGSINAKPKLYVFSTLDRFRTDVQEKISSFISKTGEIDIFLFKSKSSLYTFNTSRTFTIHLEIPVKFEIVVNEFDPPLIDNQDIIIDAITQDPDLQPLIGGFRALEIFISRQKATVLTY